MLKDVKYEFAKELDDIRQNTDNEQTKCLAIIGLTLLSEIKAYHPNKEPEIINIGNVKPLNQSQFSGSCGRAFGTPYRRKLT